MLYITPGDMIRQDMARLVDHQIATISIQLTRQRPIDAGKLQDPACNSTILSPKRRRIAAMIAEERIIRDFVREPLGQLGIATGRTSLDDPLLNERIRGTPATP